MALLTSELTRLKAELCFPVLSNGAEPYIGIAAIFETVIQPFLLSGAVTSSSTAVTAASAPTPVTLTLADATGFSAFDAVVVDVDSRQERATIQSITGNSIVVLLSKTHSGTYPVTVEGGESLVRQYLRNLIAVQDAMAESYSTAGIRRVDEIEFFGNERGGTAGSPFSHLQRQADYWRGRLAALLGLPSPSSGGGRISVY